MAKRLTEKQVVLAKSGGTPGVADAVDLSAPFQPTYGTKTGQYKQLTGKMGGEKNYVVGEYLTVSGTLEALLKSNGGGANLPKLSQLLKMSGLDENADANNNNVTYTPNSSEISDGQIVFYMDDAKREFTGVCVNLKIDFEVGAPAKASFDIQGYSTRPVEEANPSVNLDCNELFIVDSVQAVTVGGATLNLTKASFDMGNRINEIYALDQKEFYRSDFAPKITLTDNAVKGDNAHWTDFLDGNIKAINIVLTSKSGNKFTFSAPSCRYIDLGEADDAGKVAITRTFALETACGGSGGDNFSIKYE